VSTLRAIQAINQYQEFEMRSIEEVLRSDLEKVMSSNPDEVKQGQSMDLSADSTESLRQRLKAARKAFDGQGGRGVDLAEFIDCARFELRSRAARKAAQTRAAKRAL
jgi:hypothetical protein